MLKHFSAILLRVFLSRSTRTFPQHLMTNKAWLGVHTPVFSIRLKIWIRIKHCGYEVLLMGVPCRARAW